MEGEKLGSREESLLSDGGMGFAFVIAFPSFFTFGTDIALVKKKARSLDSCQDLCW